MGKVHWLQLVEKAMEWRCATGKVSNVIMDKNVTRKIFKSHRKRPFSPLIVRFLGCSCRLLVLLPSFDGGCITSFFSSLLSLFSDGDAAFVSLFGGIDGCVSSFTFPSLLSRGDGDGCCIFSLVLS